MRAKTIIIFFLCLIPGVAPGQEGDNTDYVDPFIGTSRTHLPSMWRAEASTYPGAVAPHGMLQISPQTSKEEDFLQGYYYWHDTIRGFTVAEHFSGWPNGSRGKGKVMPFSIDPGHEFPPENSLISSFSHEEESAEPGYYSVNLKDPGIHCEFTANTRSVIGRINYSGEKRNGLLLYGFEKLERKGDNELLAILPAGSHYMWKSERKLYILLKFSESFTCLEDNGKVYLSFPELKKTNNQLTFKYGGSFTSEENARLNLETEIPDWDFESIEQKSNAVWKKELNCIEITNGSEEDKIMFYTALYHASLLPLVASDVNGEFYGQEMNAPLRENEYHYQYLSPWDGFRTLYPLLNFIKPKMAADIMRSVMREYKIMGRMPEPEVMTSVHLSVMTADALSKNLTDFDYELAYKGLRDMIKEPPYFRKEMHSYDALGYVPYGEHYSTTATLEFAYNDWAMARIADYLGEKEDYDFFLKRSFNYRNNYHPEKRFMWTRDSSGSWTNAPIYAESDPWNMSWFVPHNVNDLINLMGGADAFTEHLETNFKEGHFILDNECPMNFPFLFSYAGKPWLSMKWAKKTLRTHFNTSPGGIPGNDDFGTMSSWFIWTSLGFFPACPGRDELIITGPVFEEYIIHFANGRQLRVKSKNLSEKNIYVEEMKINDSSYLKSWISTESLLRGGEIIFNMIDMPDLNLSLGPDSQPLSLTTGKPEFVIKGLNSDQNKVYSGEDLTLKVDIWNKGSSGSYPLTIFADGEEIYREWVLLNEKERKECIIPLSLYKTGKRTISALGNELSIHVIKRSETSGKNFDFSKPMVPPFVQKGEALTVNSTVKNIGSESLRVSPVVIINQSDSLFQKELQLDPGETRKLQYTLATEFSEMNTLRINTSKEVFFKIQNNPVDAQVLYYDFEDAENPALDRSGFQNHGNVIKKPVIVKGKEGNGFQFDGSYIELPATESLDITGDQLTIMYWYKPLNENGTAALVTRGTHIMLKMTNPWQIKFVAGGWGRGECFFNTKAEPDTGEPDWNNTWIHVAGVYDGKSLRLYINGKLKKELAREGVIGKSYFRWRIGNNEEVQTNREPEGIIDELMIFRSALSTEEILRKGILDASEIK
jgi:predicted alpha-1,2-mannosidase